MMRTYWGIDIFGRDTRTAGAQRPDWSEEAYLDAVEATFRQVTSSVVGSYVVRFIEMTQNKVRVYPEPQDRDPDLPPYVRPLTGGGSAAHDGSPGARSDADLFFTPGEYRLFRRQVALDMGPGRFADELLIHELVHALRCTWGLLDHSALVGCMRRFDDFEEFCAITVTNLYRSELHRPLIAFHAVGSIRRDERSADAEQSLRAQWERKLLQRFHDQMPMFVRPLSRLRPSVCPDNPFRRYFSGPLEYVPVEHPARRYTIPSR